MGRLNVDLKFSFSPTAKHAAHWNIKKDEGIITVNLPLLWAESIKRSSAGQNATEDQTIEDFIDNLGWSYLMERICLERGHEGWRIKGGRCDTPYRSHCCVYYPVELMWHPKAWKLIRKEYGRRPYQTRIAGADRLPDSWHFL